MGNPRPPRLIYGFALLFLFAAAPPALAQGDLDPPPGTPGGTMRSLEQVEPRVPIEELPYTITANGNYYLTGDLRLEDALDSDNHGIIIQANFVTLDLNGFSLIGGSGDAVHIEEPADTAPGWSLTIQNGTLRNWGKDGVELGNGGNVTLRHLKIISCGGDGVARPDPSSVVARLDHVTAHDLGGSGLSIGPGSVITNCLVYNVGGVGISGSGSPNPGGTRVENTTVRNCGQTGLALRSSSLHNVISQDNGGDAFLLYDCQVTAGQAERSINGFTAESSTLQDCVAYDNGQAGFDLSRCTVSNSVASSNQRGFAMEDSTASHCLAELNNLMGFDLVTGSAAHHCTASSNSAQGFIAVMSLITNSVAQDNQTEGFKLTTSSLRDSRAGGNASHGVLAMTGNVVHGGLFVDNGTSTGTEAGIFVKGNQNRVTDNHIVLTRDDWSYLGIKVDAEAENNLVTGNSVAAAKGSGATQEDYQITDPDNAVAPIEPLDSALSGSENALTNFGEETPP